MTSRGDSIERRQYFNRVLFAVFMSIIFYICVLLAIIFFSNFKERTDEIPVVTVRLPDKIFEEIKNMDVKQRQKFINKQRKIIKKKKEKAKREQNKVRHGSSSSNEDSSNSHEDVSNNSVTEKTINEITATTIDSNNNDDLWSDYNKKQKDQEDKIASDFYDNKNDNNKNSDSKDDYINELDNIDNTLKDISNNQSEDLGSTQNNTNNNSGTDNGSISWTGRKRKLIYNPPFGIPEKFAKTGQKYSIKLKFTVLESGLVQKVDVSESTGYPELDAYIVSKFKQRKFERTNGVDLSEGEIKINIGY